MRSLATTLAPLAIVAAALVPACDAARPPADGTAHVARDAAAPSPSTTSTRTAATARPATRPGPEPTWLDTDRCAEPCPAPTECVTETRADGGRRAACRSRCTTTEDCPAPEVCGAATIAPGYCTNDRWRELLEVDCTHPAAAEPHAHH